VAVITTPVKNCVPYLEMILGVLIGISIVDKGIYFFRRFKTGNLGGKKEAP
jgi:hypothetical protein